MCQSRRLFLSSHRKLYGQTIRRARQWNQRGTRTVDSRLVGFRRQSFVSKIDHLPILVDDCEFSSPNCFCRFIIHICQCAKSLPSAHPRSPSKIAGATLVRGVEIGCVQTASAHGTNRKRLNKWLVTKLGSGVGLS